jgi:hypothetical protein
MRIFSGRHELETLRANANMDDTNSGYEGSDFNRINAYVWSGC